LAVGFGGSCGREDCTERQQAQCKQKAESRYPANELNFVDGTCIHESIVQLRFSGNNDNNHHISANTRQRLLMAYFLTIL